MTALETSRGDMGSRLCEILSSDVHRMEILRTVADLGLPDCWVAAGFVRNTVWDALHGQEKATKLADIDVVYFDSSDIARERDRELEMRLRAAIRHERFTVKNQARMHERNGHQPYRDATDAMRYWPETCTAVGARLGEDFEVTAPFGLGDLFGLIIRPTSSNPDTLELVRARLVDKRWLETWPTLRLVPDFG